MLVKPSNLRWASYRKIWDQILWNIFGGVSFIQSSQKLRVLSASARDLLFNDF